MVAKTYRGWEKRQEVSRIIVTRMNLYVASWPMGQVRWRGSETELTVQIVMVEELHQESRDRDKAGLAACFLSSSRREED